jgi:uncharacterized protein with NAD-binding domain and iron-sulfur cluster
MTAVKGTVAVIGGGVAGLTAAHELAQRGFAVTVLEQHERVGGKARSSEVRGLPAEHGFRFFPGFYFHVPDTMGRIPAADGSGTVADHLVDGEAALLTDGERRQLLVPLPTSTSHPTWRERIAGMRGFWPAMPGPWESICFMCALARLATSCERRWEEQLEGMNWLDYAEPPGRPRPRSENYQRLFAIGLTRSFVATRAEEMSARTGGRILLQLLYDSFAGPGERGPADRSLDGPTSKVWIDPWKVELDRLGVRFRFGAQVHALRMQDDRVSGLVIGDEDEGEGFDWYVLAVPCEVLKQLLISSPELLARDPQLGRAFNLQTRWMNGLVLGLDRAPEPALPSGHVLCLDSQWALTLIDQTRIWSEEHRAPVQQRWPTLLSIDISEWGAPGTTGVPAEWMTRREHITEEVWRQLQQTLPQLRDIACPTASNLDSDVHYPRSGPTRPIAEERVDDEPLLVNTAGSLGDRPSARTAVRNLLLAGDYACTYTDFASMEAANESARRVVNVLLDAEGHAPEDRCAVCDLQPLGAFWFRAPQRVAQAIDAVSFRLALPLRAPFRLVIVAWLLLFVLTWPVRAARASRRGPGA